jgi:dinuclear metal center YbgI/SA1388 family protein
MHNIQEVVSFLNTQFPPSLAEEYDNVGLLVGDSLQQVTGVLISLDCTEAILDEAIAKQCNIVVCHHPIIFKGLKKITGANYVQRIIIKAIQNNIAIYACHTNLDNMLSGVNDVIANKIGLINKRILAPRTDTLSKLITYAPVAEIENIKATLFAAGAGNIGQYADCSFVSTGTGSFRPLLSANPKIGLAGGPQEQVSEAKLEFLVPQFAIHNVLKALHELSYYETKAYEIIQIQNANQTIGSGLIAELPEALTNEAFLHLLKHKMKLNCIRHTQFINKKIKNIALCGGSGSFLMPNAIAAGADAYISADFKYHEFFDADAKLLIADIGHYESEQFTSEIFYAQLRKKFPIFALFLTDINTNPINYFY